MLAEETLALFRACLLGAALGFCFDLLRILRYGLSCPSFLVAIQDIAYCIFAALSTFSFILAFHDGELRMFLLVGELLGGILYFFTISLLLMKMAKTIIGVIRWIFRWCYRLLLAPPIKLFCWIGCRIKKLFLNTTQKVSSRIHQFFHKRQESKQGLSTE